VTPSLAFGPPGRGDVFQREADLQVIAVDDQADRSLPGLAAHAAEEFTEGFDVPLQQGLAGIALDDDRLVEQQPAALGVVTPDATALREGSGSAEQRAQHFQRLLDPEPLVDGLVAAILARDEQHEQGRCGLAGP
jgi:hypothetical protein